MRFYGQSGTNWGCMIDEIDAALAAPQEPASPVAPEPFGWFVDGRFFYKHHNIPFHLLPPAAHPIALFKRRPNAVDEFRTAAQRLIDEAVTGECREPGYGLVPLETLSELRAALAAQPSAQEPAQSLPTARDGTAEFWASVFPDGASNENIKKELSDFYFMMGEVPKVYMEVTGGKLSKPNYHASTVIAEFEQYMSDQIDEAVKAALAEASPQPPAQERVASVAIPREVFDWLMGENGDFECPTHRYFRGKPAPFWWRSELRSRIAKAVSAGFVSEAPEPNGQKESAHPSEAWKWGYEYLQGRMESIGRHGWAHDCDEEIAYRIDAARAAMAPKTSE